MNSSLFKELFNPPIKSLFIARQRVIYIYSLLIITACLIMGSKRLISGENLFLILINTSTILSLLFVIFITRKGHIVFAGILLSLTILTPATLVIMDNPSRLGDNALYIAFVPIVNLFLMRDKRISLVIFLGCTLLLSYLFGLAQLFFLPFLTIFVVHMVYFFFFSIHIDRLEAELLSENKRKQLLINDLEMKNIKIRQLNQALGKTNHTLQEKVEDVQHFAYLSSHNLQNPLNNIQVYSSLLKKNYASKLDEEGVTSLNYLNESSTTLSTILHGLVDYFAIFEDNEAEQLVLEEIIQEIITEAGGLIDNEKVTINYEQLPIILGQRKEIKRLFQGIIQNALIHNQSKSNLQIEILAKEIEDKIQFSVIDNGVGIPKNDLEKIFKIYVSSIDFSRGIGLAIAKKIVANYNGTIWVESVLGKGTAMHFTLKTKVTYKNLHSSTPITSISADY